MADQPKGGFNWQAFTPEDSPKTPLDLREDALHHDLATAKLAVGDVAHDFSRPLYDFSTGRERVTGEVFHLAEVASAMPVALVFGSYT